MNIREARLEDAEAIALVHVNSWQTTYRGLLPEDYIAKRSYEKRLKNWKKRLNRNSETTKTYFTYVAENAVGEIIGFIDGGLARDNSAICTGEIYALYILEAYQRRRIGRSLVRSTASRLFKLGLTSIMVWVLENNPSVEFYQALGGQRTDKKTIKIGDDEFTEIAYSWGDIQTPIND